jgi:ribonuclease-3
MYFNSSRDMTVPDPQTSHNRLITLTDVEDILNKLGPIGDNGTPLKIKSLIPYQTAFVHKSYSHETDPLLNFIPVESNERLEFLGDSYIGAVVGKYLIDRFPEEQEGFLTKIRTRLVRTNMLHRFARFLGIGSFILLSPQVQRLTHIGPNKGRNNPRLYEDCFEAFIGALIQDFGDEEGYRYAKRFLLGIIEHIVDFADIISTNENFKDTLQRYYQSLKWKNPVYVDLDECGPSHIRNFTKGAFLEKENLERLSEKVKKQTIEYHHEQLRCSNSKLREAIEKHSEDTGTWLIGLGLGTKKACAEQSCSSIALCNLDIHPSW